MLHFSSSLQASLDVIRIIEEDMMFIALVTFFIRKYNTRLAPV